ncbi:MAG: tRNA (guanosine(46)-N7)-methyltransferase TrmB [Fodinibius sp.]|nr:tRNA (guanosine(46)-N7)-methyltransferase TrmB [Fodinibius sp.]
MGKGKLEKFEEVTQFPNTLELTDFQESNTEKPRGRWHADVFGNNNPINLELACGKGTYTLELARRNPNKNYLGIDIKGDRIWRGAKTALDEDLDNARFMRMYIDHLKEYFAPNEISNVWITFPDPYPRSPDSNKRLTSPKFLNIYQQVLKPDAVIQFKTDNEDLFAFTKETLSETGCEVLDLVEDVYRERPDDELLTIKTDFEEKHLERGRSISYLKFTLPGKFISV